MRLRFLLAFALVLGFAQGALAQAPAPISAFFGTYTGTGLADNKDSVYFGVTERDLDVVIHPDGQGFSLAWTTVAHQGGSPTKPKVKRREDRVVFVPGPAPGTWRTASEPDPFSGNPLMWARIEGRSLIVYAFSIDAKGRTEMQRYTRTLAPGGLELTFIAGRDGERLRTVKGKLVKVSN